MVNKAPNFWWNEKSIAQYFLAPFSWGYGFVSKQNMNRRKPPVIDLPVFCIGNFTLGGAGKTPVAIALSKQAVSNGFKPGIVTRGYKSKIENVHMVDIKHDSAKAVGDEPLFLARHASVVISPNRLKAAQQLKSIGCNFIIMDDGFQSRRLYADYSLLVIDALRGVGNGAVFPGGPLRAPLDTQFNHTDALLVIGEGHGLNQAVKLADRYKKKLFHANLLPSADGKVDGENFLAFSGIGNPEKFYTSIRSMGGNVCKIRNFADHHYFTQAELQQLSRTAEKSTSDWQQPQKITYVFRLMII